MKRCTSEVTWFRLMLSVLLVVGPIVACQSKEDSPPESDPDLHVTLEEADAGRVVNVNRGQDIVIRLASNRTTGYSWALVSPEAGILSRPNAPVYAPDSAATRMAGTGGMESWSFKANQSGHEELRFEYRRPFERNAPPAKTASYVIRVR